MTISTTASRISYNGNGATTVFAVPFRFFANTDLVVQLVTVSTGASTTLTLTTNYTVTGADDDAGGSLTMLVAPAVGQRLVIRRVIAATQEVDYVAGDPFPAETHERALDRLTMLAQQNEEVNARALVFPSGDTASGELPAVATRANKLLGFSDTGELVVSAPASGSSAELALDLAASGGAGLVGFLQSGTGAVARTAQSKMRDVVSVKDFGAVGDGVSDDTAAVQAALATGKPVDGNQLTCKVTGQLTAQSDIFNFSIVADYVPAVAGDAVVSVLTDGVAIDNVQIDCTGKNLLGFLFSGASKCRLSSASVSNSLWAGVFVNNSSFIDLESVEVNGCGGTFVGGSIQIMGTSSYVTHKLCSIQNAVGKGFVAMNDGCHHVTYESCFAQDCAFENYSPREGAKFINYTSCRSIKTDATGTGVSGVKMSRNASFINWVNCYFYQESSVDVSAALHNQGCQNITVSNCFIHANNSRAVLMSNHGVTLTKVSNVLVEACDIKSNITGITVSFLPGFGSEIPDNITVKGNTIDGSRPVDVLDIVGFSLSDNYIKNTSGVASVAAVLVTSSTGTIRPAKITGNRIESWGGSSTIRIFRGTNSHISENVVSATAGSVIQMDDASENFIERNIVSGVFSNAIVNQSNSTENRIVGNNITGDGTGFGIRNTTGAHYVTHNSIANVATRITPLSGGAGSTVQGNTFNKALWDTAAPTSGDYLRGDVVYNLSPSASGFVGWVCVASGTPGTWKTFGAVSA